MSIQLLFGHSGDIPASGDKYGLLDLTSGDNGADTTQYIGAAGNLQNFKFKATTAPGVGTSYSVSVHINGGAASAITITLSGTNTTATYNSSTVAVSATDFIEYRFLTVSGSPTYAQFSCNIELDTTADGEQVFGSDTTANGTVSPKYQPLFAPCRVFFTSAADCIMTVPMDMTLTTAYLRTATAPSAGNGLTSYIYLKRVGELSFTKQDGTGGTVDTKLDCLGTSVLQSKSFSLPLAQGDKVYVEYVVTGSFTTRHWYYTYRGVAEVPGQFVMAGLQNSAPNNSTTQYNNPFAHTQGWNSTEATAIPMIGPSNLEMRWMFVDAKVAPDTGNSWN